MSSYERKQWERLNTHWDKRNNARGLPNWAHKAGENAAKAASRAAEKAGEAIPDAVWEQAGRAADAVLDRALRPVLQGALALLTLVDEWAMELNDPQTVVDIAKKRRIPIDHFSELRDRDLRDCDRLLTAHTLKWRSAGAIEGAGIGALALVPVAGLPAAMTADIVVIQILSVSIASRTAYAYGFDAKNPEERAFIEHLVRRSFTLQAGKAKPLVDASRGYQAIKGRSRWSQKLRQDHRLIEAVEKLMQKWLPKGQVVSVKHVAKALPVISILLSSGANSEILARVAKDAERFCQTRFLSEKYGLPMPAALRRYDLDPDSPSPADGHPGEAAPLELAVSVSSAPTGTMKETSAWTA
ncbi:EcsC family protein [Intrasporangium flavum]|uniref:EcsC family protein n=1 Tax=Intrasporangium flavum TaxID=1428657 RepID=UPI00096F76EB|nr:EcsC family protein [Intrasporangium flavum]